MRSAFPGFPAEGLAFFSRLQRNNRRESVSAPQAIFEETLKQGLPPDLAATPALYTEVVKHFRP